MRRGRLGHPPRVRGSGNGIHRETRNRYMVGMTIHAVRVESNYDMRPVAADQRNQLCADPVYRRVCKVLVLIVQQIHLRNAKQASGLTKLGFAEFGQGLAIAQWRISHSPGVTTSRRNQDYLCTTLYVAPREAGGHKALVIWMGKNQQDAGWNRHPPNIVDERGGVGPAIVRPGAPYPASLFALSSWDHDEDGPI